LVKFFFSKFWHGDAGQDSVERRAASRHEMQVVCTTAFATEQAERTALLLDISRTGAKFGTAIDASKISMETGQVLRYYVSTPFGADTWIGRVVWTRPGRRIHVWGVQFTEQPGERPLEQLLQQPVVAS
jgi:hypothetical protein